MLLIPGRLSTLSQRVTVASSIGAAIAPDAPFDMNALNAEIFIQPQNVRLEHKAVFVASELPTPNHVSLPTSLSLPTPINLSNFSSLLTTYPLEKANYLIRGFGSGFPIQFEGNSSEYFAPNLLSAVQLPHVVDAKLAKELAAHRIAGPFEYPPFLHFRVSPLGVVPKKVLGEFRLIHHLSYPHGTSVNDGISPEHSHVTYARIDDAIQLVKKVGVGGFLAKTDIKNAFRVIPIQPEDFHLLGMFWRGKYYYDRCLPMGCSSSCKIFESFSTSLEWIARQHLDILHIIHLLDDFLLAGATWEQCNSHLLAFLNLCDWLGVPMAPEKTMGPLTTLSFAGIELDTMAMEARLPDDKLQKCIFLVTDFVGRKKVTLCEMQSLIGTLNFACSVVVPGRAFLRRLIDLTRGITKAHHYIRLNRSVKADLQLWLTFLHAFNGRSLFLHDGWLDSNTLQLYTDASGSLGYGATFGDDWCYGTWPDQWKGFNIAILEFFPHPSQCFTLG